MIFLKSNIIIKFLSSFNKQAYYIMKTKINKTFMNRLKNILFWKEQERTKQVNFTTNKLKFIECKFLTYK